MEHELPVSHTVRGATSSVQDCIGRSMLCGLNVCQIQYACEAEASRLHQCNFTHCCLVGCLRTTVIHCTHMGWQGRRVFCRKLPEKFGDLLSEDQLKQIEELGLLADLDDQVN